MAHYKSGRCHCSTSECVPPQPLRYLPFSAAMYSNSTLSSPLFAHRQKFARSKRNQRKRKSRRGRELKRDGKGGIVSGDLFSAPKFVAACICILFAISVSSISLSLPFLLLNYYTVLLHLLSNFLYSKLEPTGTRLAGYLLQHSRQTAAEWLANRVTAAAVH